MLSYACEARVGVEGGGATRGVHVSVFLISVQTNSAACYSITEHKSPPQSKKEKKIQKNLQLSMTDGKNNAK